MELQLDLRLIQIVSEFHHAANLPVRVEPASVVVLQRYSKRNLADSEVRELAFWLSQTDESESNQFVKIIDALGDIAYAAAGHCLELGLPLVETLASQVREMIASDAFEGEIITLDDVAEWYWRGRSLSRRPPPMVTLRAYRRSKDDPVVRDVDALVREMNRHSTTFLEALEAFDIMTMALACTNMILGSYEMGFRLGVHLGTVLEEIHRSNMTKTIDLSKDRSTKVQKDGEGFEPPNLGGHRFPTSGSTIDGDEKSDDDTF